MSRPENRKWAALSFVAFVFLLDVGSKEAIVSYFQLHESEPVTTFFNLGYWLNPGAAFSFLSDAGGWQRYFFSAIALGVVICLCFALWNNASLKMSSQAAFALVAGGAVGNLYDRITRGAVVDWIDLHVANWHWPAFNIADCAIVAGAAILVISQAGAGSHRDE